MDKTQLPTNYIKHTTPNVLQKFLIRNFYTSLISLAKPLKPKTVLDAGCGEGFTMEKLNKNGIGIKIEGIEYSKDAILLGRKLFPHLIFKQGSAYQLPYKDSSFDLVICTEVLEHLKKPVKVLRELLRVSKKYVLLSVPNEPFFILANFLRGKNLSHWGNDPDHINHWTAFSFIKFVKQNNVEIVKARFPFPWTIILAKN